MADTGDLRIEAGVKRVRIELGGQVVAETDRPLLVWERPYYPEYYVPVADVRAKLVPTGERVHSASRGSGDVHTVHLDGLEASDAATTYPDPPSDRLRDHVRFEWGAMDAWFEEDEEIFVHPRNPYTRVDALRSSKHVVVEVDGLVVADTRSPAVLYETGLIPRTYIPPTDVRRDLLATSDTVTRCPYKGEATYFHLHAGEAQIDDIAWTYRFPTREAAPIAGLICFHDEKVDVTVDGVRQPRPHSPRLPGS